MTMGPEIEVLITDRQSTISRRMFQYSDLEVDDPLSDARTCRFKCPIYDINSLGQSNVQHFIPLERMVKVFYRGYLIFWGQITKPIFNFAEGTVEVNAHDPSLFWKFHHFRTGDDALDGVRVNGAGLWDLADAANPYFSETGLHPGIVLGQGTNYLLDGESTRREYRPARGDNVFDAIQTVSEAADGPDWRLIPIDENNDDFGVWEDGYTHAFQAIQEISRERQDEVVFHYGFGRTNLANFIYEPDGLEVRNRYVAENSRGVIRVGHLYNDGNGHGTLFQGIMEDWQQESGRGATPEALEAKAQAMVQAYAAPLPVFTIEPMWDQGLMGSAASTPWRYPSGYHPGDRIRAVAKAGNMSVDLVGRVIRVTLTQMNAAENVKAQIECIPQPIAVDDVIVDDLVTG